MDGKYDILDLGILRELRDDSKQSYRKLAAKLKIHPNTLMERIKRLEHNKLITHYRIEIDYRKLGFDIHAVIMIRTHKKRSLDLWELEGVAKIPQVQLLYAVTGNYDAVAVVRVRTREELVEVLRKVQDVPAVIRTTTFTVLRSFKRADEFNPLDVMV